MSFKIHKNQVLGYSCEYSSLMRPRRDTNQIFTFYQCDAPSNEYDSEVCGQLVSNDDGLCIDQ